jgi:hypothetical protein
MHVLPPVLPEDSDWNLGPNVRTTSQLHDMPTQKARTYALQVVRAQE